MLASYVQDDWHTSTQTGVIINDATYDTPIVRVDSNGINFAQTLEYARKVGSVNLRKLTFHERAFRLKELAKHLLSKKDLFYELSYQTGATPRDAWIDIDGGIATLFSYSSLARREFPDERFLLEGEVLPLSKHGSFVGRHILVPKEGVALHINAFNFPCWGMLEKLAPTLLAGVAAVVKPASQTAFVTQAVVKEMIASGLLPGGALQLICGSVGDTFEHLTAQDVVTFTGSASTGRMLKTHPVITGQSVPFNLEADSLNSIILGESVKAHDEEFTLFVNELVNEMSIKTGQRCTAIRRAIVPRKLVDAVTTAVSDALAKVRAGDPRDKHVRLGPLVSHAQVQEVTQRVAQLSAYAEVISAGQKTPARGAFFPATVLYCDAPFDAPDVHNVEAFGPVTTLMPYDSLDDAVALAKLGQGSLVASVVTRDPHEARTLVFGTASHHGRLLILNRDNAKESTGHGSPLPTLVHGGPGRAGGGEELGGARAVKHYMQRTAVQADPTLLMSLTREYTPGARTITDRIHPFKKTFDELQIGEQYTTHHRTVTETDIVNFACLTGDHFYAHTDEPAARASLFGKRVAHGYFLISAAAGLFVDPAPGPVLANYGLESLRFITPVGMGDTIGATLTVKQKTRKEPREGEQVLTGVVAWDVRLSNQHDETVATYTILTLVKRQAP